MSAVGRDPEAHGGFVSAHAQHRALPARQPRRLRSGARQRAARRAGGARPLGAARARAQLQEEIVAAYRKYAVPPDLPEGAQLLRRGPRRLLSRRAEGPAVHHAGAERARRSAQTAMFTSPRAMVRWLAPILSFTAEEIWQLSCRASAASRCSSSTWHALPQVRRSDAHRLGRVLIALRSRRDARAREAARCRRDRRAARCRGRCLLRRRTCSQSLQALGDELRFCLHHVRGARAPGRQPLRPEALPVQEARTTTVAWIVVRPTAATKCVRCWHHRPEWAVNAEHPELCGRCVTNIAGPGEQRRFV